MKGWTGGLNREADPYLLDLEEVPDAINVDFGLRGEVSKRKGYTLVSSDHSTATASEYLWVWRKLGAADNYFTTDRSGRIWWGAGSYTDSGVAFGAHSGADRNYQIATSSINDKLYFTSLRTGATPQSFDGTTWTALTVSDFTETAGQFPRAAFTLAAYERVFCANVVTQAGTPYRSRMYFSNLLDAEKWGALDYLDFAPDNGQEITAITQFGEAIIVFKNRSIFSLVGSTPSSFSVYPVDDALGTECPNTVVSAGPILLWFDHLTGVWAFDGSSYKKVDDKINKYLLNGTNAAYAYRSAAFAYRGRYFLSVPWGEDTYPSRTFVYDSRIEAWTEYDFGFSGAAIKDALMYAGGNRDAVGIFKMWDADTDAGSNIAAKFATAWMAPEPSQEKFRLRRLDMALSAFGDYNIGLLLRRNFTKDAYVSQTINTSPGGALFDTALFGTDKFGSGVTEVLRRTTGWGKRWRTAQLEFSENTNTPFQVNRLVLQVSKLGRKRGEP